MEYVIRDMEYVSGSDFEDEPLGFPGTLDSDPLPTSEIVEPVEEVNSAPSPEPETQEAPVESETTEPVLVEDVQTTQVSDLESGPWKVSILGRKSASRMVEGESLHAWCEVLKVCLRVSNVGSDSCLSYLLLLFIHSSESGIGTLDRNQILNTHPMS